MLKILVFDSGWGGELFANYLEKELAVVDIIRLSDWHHSPHSWYEPYNLRNLVEYLLLPYIGEVDVIVLASYTVTSAALDWLKRKYPSQVFVGFELRLFYQLREVSQRRALVAANQRIYQSPAYRSAKERLRQVQQMELVELECDGWSSLIDGGRLSKNRILQTLGNYNWREDVLVLCNTHYLDIKPRLEEMFDWRIQVLDDFKYVAEKVYRALGFTRQYERRAGTLPKERRAELRLIDKQITAAIREL